MRPLGRLVEAGDAVEDGRLAGAVGADERGDVAAADRERQVAHGDEAAEAHGQVLDDEQRIAQPAHQPCPSLTWAPDTAFASLSAIDGSREAMSPRGRHTIITTMARPKMQHAVLRRVEVVAEDRLQPVELAQELDAADDHRPRRRRRRAERAHAAEHDDGEDRRRFR